MLGGGSDYAVFLNHLGIAALDFGFRNDEIGFPVYHSVYDSFSWQNVYCNFDYHVAVARLWGLLAMRLSGDQTMPLNITDQAEVLQSYYESALKLLKGPNLPSRPDIATEPFTTHEQQKQKQQ